MDNAPKTAKVLLVEDNKINLEVALEILEPLALDIDTASDGKKAIEKITQNSYEFVFMDYLMPVLDGAEATKAIRQAGIDENILPIVALTAGNEDIELLLSCGMNDVLIKPLSLEKAKAMLQKYLPSKAADFEESCSTVSTEKESEDSLPEIPGIDTSLAMEHCSSASMVHKMWHDFASIAEYKTEEISALLRNSNINNFRIEVHALKSSANLIGAVSLSKKFESLEAMAKANDVAELQKATPLVLVDYLSLKKMILAVLNDAPKEQIEVPTNSIEALLDQLIGAANDMFLDGVDESLAELERCILPPEVSSDFEKLKYYVFEVNLTEAVKIAETLKEKL